MPSKPDPAATDPATPTDPAADPADPADTTSPPAAAAPALPPASETDIVLHYQFANARQKPTCSTPWIQLPPADLTRAQARAWIRDAATWTAVLAATDAAGDPLYRPDPDRRMAWPAADAAAG